MTPLRAADICCRSDVKPLADKLGPFLIAVLLMLSTAASHASQEDASDVLNSWPEESAMHTIALQMDRRHDADESVKRKHAILIDLLEHPRDGGMLTNSSLLYALAAQQKAWFDYRQHECELVGALTGAGGNWPTAWEIICEADQAESRLEIINSTVACVEKSYEAEASLDRIECLEKLVSIKGGLSE